MQTCRNSSCRHTLFGFTLNLMDNKLISSYQLFEPILIIFHHLDQWSSTPFLLLPHSWRWEWANVKDKAFTLSQEPEEFPLPWKKAGQQKKKKKPKSHTKLRWASMEIENSAVLSFIWLEKLAPLRLQGNSKLMRLQSTKQIRKTPNKTKRSPHNVAPSQQQLEF